MISNRIQEKVYSPQIDGLRGLAIVMILLHHCFGKGFSFLWIGVDLFFVLSGFLITRILINSLNDKNYFLNFYVRRTLRVFPLYYTVLFFVLFILPLVFSNFDVTYLKNNQLYYWLYIENWLIYKDGWPKGSNIIIAHFWSLAIEEQYYLFWPFFIYLFRKNISKIIFLILGLILVSLCFRIFGNLPDPAYYVATNTRMDGLLIGSLVSVVAKVNLKYLNQFVLVFFYASLAFLLLILLFSFNLAYSNPFLKTIGYTIIAVFFGSVVTLSFGEKLLINRFLDNKFLKFFGKYSYGMYVFHFPIFWLLRTPLFDFFFDLNVNYFMSKTITSVFVLILTKSFSLISYHLLELPFLKLKKYFE
jgi:peptidoglycan/LPS O-acetylase OafA/YrhL